MKFTLKDYQDEAVEEVLDRLKKARKRWHEDRDKHAFSLTATTGAGKTVMAAAVFEALFHGNDDYNFEPDPGAVVIWFSDDPSLKEQSRWRLQEASDKLTISDLVPVESTFAREKFEPGKIYFLNTRSSRRTVFSCAATTPTILQSKRTIGRSADADHARSAIAHHLGHHPEHHRRP
jgi:type III restriction enzyme